MDYVSVEDARGKTGLRLALTAGVPGPWGEGAKGVFKARNVPFTPVLQEVGAPNEELVAWTGHRNAPIAVFEDEPARTGWAEILFLAERIGSGPSLIPEDAADRALMLGLSHELLGENGLAWTRRLSLAHSVLEAGAEHPGYDFWRFFGGLYGYTRELGAAAERRAIAILEMLSHQLAEQERAGRSFLVGDALSAVDIYWATTVAMVVPLPPEACDMAPDFRALYEAASPAERAAASPPLLAHRDRIYREVLGLPMDF